MMVFRGSKPKFAGNHPNKEGYRRCCKLCKLGLHQDAFPYLHSRQALCQHVVLALQRTNNGSALGCGGLGGSRAFNDITALGLD
jgi:hypothetical protein